MIDSLSRSTATTRKLRKKYLSYSFSKNFNSRNSNLSSRSKLKKLFPQPRCRIRQPQNPFLPPPPKLEGKYSTQNLRGWPPPLSFHSGEVSASEARRHPPATPLESDRIENGSSWQRAARKRGGRGGVIRGATVGNRGHEGAEREREIGRRRKLFSLFEIEIYRTIYFTSIFFYPFFISLSFSRFEPRFQGRQMMRVPRGDVVTSLVLPPFLYPPPCERHLFHPAVTRICNFLFVRIHLSDW